MNYLLSYVDYFVISIFITLSLENILAHYLLCFGQVLSMMSIQKKAQCGTETLSRLQNIFETPPPMDIMDVIYCMPNVLGV